MQRNRHDWKQSVKLSLRLVYLVYGSYSSNADFLLFLGGIETPCLGLLLNLHDDPNMNEQKMVLLT